jgi:hypothetical protein
MGYIEETGVAQHYRDARIAPIYEGTNGIQAIDLVGRKLPMRGGDQQQRGSSRTTGVYSGHGPEQAPKRAPNELREAKPASKSPDQQQRGSSRTTGVCSRLRLEQP